MLANLILYFILFSPAIIYLIGGYIFISSADEKTKKTLVSIALLGAISNVATLILFSVSGKQFIATSPFVILSLVFVFFLINLIH